MNKIMFAIACLISVAVCAVSPSYVIMIQQDAVRLNHRGAFTPSREVRRELDKACPCPS